MRIDISLSSEIFLLKIVKMILTNLRRKYLPHLLEKSKRVLLTLPGKIFQSDQIKDGYEYYEQCLCICRCSLDFTVIEPWKPIYLKQQNMVDISSSTLQQTICLEPPRNITQQEQ